MDIESLILKELSKKKKIKVADIVKITGFSRAYINRFFNGLEKQGKIFLIGKANKAHYVLADNKSIKEIKKEARSIKKILKNKNLSEDLIFDEIDKNTGIFIGLPQNVKNIANYSFTEILNNAIEHSNSEKINISMDRNNKITFEVIDFGIGIFNNIMEKRGLKDRMEAIQDLLKGKQTTAPKEHTGEGIFFTSKLADILIIQSSDKKLIFDNIINDVFIKDSRPIKGTKVKFEINAGSKRKLEEIFKNYSGKTFEFAKTRVIVKLYKMDNAYISRSQARRILSGLEKFKEIILDFQDVETIGQAFADEVFRVWQNNHKKIKIVHKNSNENILFMIKRAM